MHRRYESMTARNGDVEDVGQHEDSGIGVRALVGSGWGFFAVPDLSDDRRPALAGAQATAIAAASATVSRAATPSCVPGEVAHRVVVERVRDRPARRVAGRQGRPARRATATMRRARRRPRRGDVPDLGHREVVRVERGHRIDQRIRECGAGIMATAIGDGETQRRSYPAARGQYGTRGWELVDEIDLEAHAARVAEESRALLSAPRVPERRDDADPRRRADGAADPRVGRPRHRARPHPRLGGGLRRHVVARPRPARRRCSTARS